MKDYMFTDCSTRESFFVEVPKTDSVDDAFDRVCEIFGTWYAMQNMECNGCFSVAQAEIMGLDTY